MSLVKFSAYATSTQYPGIEKIPADHIFVCPGDGSHNWNCFGGGCEIIINKSRELRKLENGSGSGNARWASLIYGPSSEGDPNFYGSAAGIRNVYDGVCHNVANRILVITGEGIDVSGAAGNELVTLMYGKFGYNIEKFIDNVRITAKLVNEEQPGTLTDQEIEDVVNRITRGVSPDNELEILKKDLDEHFGPHLSHLSDEERSKFDSIYKDFQDDRKTAYYDAEPQTGTGLEFQRRFADRIEPHLKTCLLKLDELLGRDRFLALFKGVPESVIAAAKGFLFMR